MRILITGVTGQDGSYFADLALSKGDEVAGIVRRTSQVSTANVDRRVQLYSADMCDMSSLIRVVEDFYPDWIINFAAQSHVGTSFKQPYATIQSTFIGVLNLLEVVRQAEYEISVYQACSSEQYGNSGKEQTFNTPMCPVSPYGVAKLGAYHLCKVYRQSYGLDIRLGILHNHDSERRGHQFVTRKISLYVAYVSRCKQAGVEPQYKLKLGNINTVRDFGYAPDYVDAIYRIMEYDGPEYEWIVSTGEPHTIREFLEEAFSVIDIDDWEKYVELDSYEYVRPNELDYLKGDSSLIREKLGWKPTVHFKDLVYRMVINDIKNYPSDLPPPPIEVT